MAPLTRPIALRSWLVRLLIPSGLCGSYTLFSAAGSPTYTGRSDSDLRERLLTHAADARGDYFRFDIHSSAEQAYLAECSAYHAWGPSLENAIHPARPGGSCVQCPFCRPTLLSAFANRISLYTDPLDRRNIP